MDTWQTYFCIQKGKKQATLSTEDIAEGVGIGLLGSLLRKIYFLQPQMQGFY